VLLRDYLRSHPDAAERYGRRKLEVAHLITGEGPQAYMEAKASIVEELLTIARREPASWVTRITGDTGRIRRAAALAVRGQLKPAGGDGPSFSAIRQREPEGVDPHRLDGPEQGPRVFE
jgi:hypothetical protein